MRRAVALGIDAVLPKVLHQGDALAARGWAFDVLTMHRGPRSLRTWDTATIVALEAGPVGRARQVWRHLGTDGVHHVELYVAGRFAPLLALMAKLRRLPVIAVERGDLSYLERHEYPATVRLAMLVAYRLADVIWFKEPWMEPVLERRGLGGRARFLPNAVPVPPGDDVPSARDIDIVWANRVLPERHPDWLAAALREHRAPPPTVAVIGFDPEPGPWERSVRASLDAIDGVRCEPFGDPSALFPRSRFFVLPGDAVFGNFAMLEAMAVGVVPIVSAVPGTEHVVRDGENGIVAEHSERGWAEAVARALALPEIERERLSAAARQTVVTDFGLDAWADRLLALYAEVDRRSTRRS